MKFITLIFCTSLMILSTVGCSTNAASEQAVPIDEQVKELPVDKINAVDVTKLKQALFAAKQNKDYRLLVTSGRSISVPGVQSADYQAVLALCGKNYNSAVGDVIKSPQQRLERKKQIEFMRQYNEKMVVICQKALQSH